MTPFFKSDYYQYKKERKATLVYNAGLIIYPDNDKIIPQEVLLIPYQRNFELSFADDIQNALQNTVNKGFTVYFQGMRRVQPDLMDVLIGCHYEKAFLSGDRVIPLDFKKANDNVRVTFGIIVCETTWNNITPNFDNGKILYPELCFGNSLHKIICNDLPHSYGTPVAYINYDPESYFHSKADSLNKTNP
jgi:hypothetical protein